MGVVPDVGMSKFRVLKIPRAILYMTGQSPSSVVCQLKPWKIKEGDSCNITGVSHT